MNTVRTAKRLDNLSEYIFSRLEKEVAKIEMESKRKVLNLGIGSPDFTPKKLYLEKLTEFFQDSKAHLYPGYGASKEFSDALKNWYKKRFDIDIYDNELHPLLGAKDGIAHLALTLLDTDDEVLVPDPGYPAFSYPAIMIGAKPIFYDLTEENNFKIDLKELEKKLSNKTKFIWINFPSNPTGQTITIGELEKIVDFAKERNLFIVYDNAYSEITFDGYLAPSILQIPNAKEIAVEIGSFSKIFSFAGFRMGWIVGNKDIVSALAKVKSHFDSGLSLPLQKLGAFALNNYDEKWHQEMINSYKNRRDVIAEKLKKIDLEFALPKGSLYIWAKIPNNYKNSEEFCIEFLRKKQILVAPGTAYGKNGERYVRVSISADISNIENYLK